MKRIFTLIATALMLLPLSATDYTDVLKVTVRDVTSTQTAKISVTQEADGKYTFELKDFKLVGDGNTLPVGNIVISGVEAVEKDGVKGFALAKSINITNGSDPNEPWIGPGIGEVPLRLSAEFTADKLYTNISINLVALNQQIKVEFGNRFSTAFYQVQNSNFEEFSGTGSKLEPKYWHSFGSAIGSYAGSVNSAQQVSVSNDVRPGSTGTKSVRINARSIFFGMFIANANLTTGRIVAGSMTASNTANHNVSDPTDFSTDQNGDPFVQAFFGRPDSLVVWVKFVPGSTTRKDSASIRATIHDNTRYQDPVDKVYTNVVATATAYTERTNNQWVRLSVPFTYTENDVVPANILFSISTNKNPGAGSGSDALFIDDLELIYKEPLVTSIRSTNVTTASASDDTGIYTLDGRRVNTPTAGNIYIVKEAGKTARKVRF